MPPISPESVELPDDNASLKAVIRSLLLERDGEKRRADDLQVENLRLQLELERFRKWYYGPRADRLQSDNDLAQMLLHFAEEMDRKPVNPDDVPRDAKPEEEPRRVKRRRCWPRCARSFSCGRNSCCPNTPWPRRSTTPWANGRN